MTELCIDFGGSSIKVGVCDDGRILASSELPVAGSPDDLARAAAELRRLIGALASEGAESTAARVADDASVSAAGGWSGTSVVADDAGAGGWSGACIVADDAGAGGAGGASVVADDAGAGGAGGTSIVADHAGSPGAGGWSGASVVADDAGATGAGGAGDAGGASIVADDAGAGGAGGWGGASVVAIAVPGVVDRRTASLVAAHDKYDYLTGFDLDAWARETFGLPGVVENDARAALLGEARYGVARGAQNAVIAIFGTGIGTAALLDGRLLHGGHDHAGILGGHITVDLDGPVCNCGNVGCAEAIASTWALERTLTAVERRLAEQNGAGDAQPHRNRPGRPDNSKRDENLAAIARGEHDAWRSPVDDSDRDPKGSLDEGAGTLRARIGAGRGVGIADVVETRDETASRALLDLYLRAWSAAIVGLCHAYDPDVVVVSGGVMRSRDLILPELTRQVHEHLCRRSGRRWWCPSDPTPPSCWGCQPSAPQQPKGTAPHEFPAVELRQAAHHPAPRRRRGAER